MVYTFVMDWHYEDRQSVSHKYLQHRKKVYSIGIVTQSMTVKKQGEKKCK